MKNIVRILAMIVVIAFLPVTANAYSQHRGIFIASDYSDAYHILFCRDVSKIGKHRTYYESTDDAEADEKRPCYHCGSFIRIIRGDYTGTEHEREIVDVFLEGYYAGQNVGYDSAYEDWHEERYSDGYNMGYSDGAKDAKEEAQAEYEAKLEEELSAASKKQFWISGFSFVPLLIFACGLCAARSQRKADDQIAELRKQINQYKAGWQQSEVLSLLGLIADESDAKARLQAQKRKRP